MSRVLLVTEAARSYREFRRRWVRRLHEIYVRRYRATVARAATRLSRDHEVTVLTARQLVDETALPAGVTVRYYDDESFKVDSRDIAKGTHGLVAGWWPDADREPDLRYRDIWLPDLLTVAKALLLRVEITERLGALEQVLDETRPDEVWVLSGASTPERLARLLGRGRRLGVRAASRALLPHLFAVFTKALFAREERLRLGALLHQPRREVAAWRGAGRRLLFVTCRPRHHFVVDPLVEAARAAGADGCVLTISDEDPESVARIQALVRGGMPAGYCMDFLPKADAQALVRRYRPILRRAWRRIARDRGLAERLEWNRVSLLPVLRPFLRSTIQQSMLTALLHLEAAFRAFDALRPEAVVITSDRRYAERAAALVARARGIPSVLYSNTLILTRDRTNIFDVGDRILVIGEHLRDALVSDEGVNPARVIVVGDPRSNAARLVPVARLREEVRRDLGLAPGRPLVVLISKYVSLVFSSREREDLYRTVYEAARRLADVDVVVKVHPNEDLDRLREQVKEWGCPEARLTKDYDIHRLFGAADAAVMVTSMAGLEAMALGCPVVAVQTRGKDFEGEYAPPYVSAGTVARVDLGDATGLAAALGRVLRDPAERAALVGRGQEFSTRYIHPVDGRLADRLLAVVDEIRREGVREVRR